MARTPPKQSGWKNLILQAITPALVLLDTRLILIAARPAITTNTAAVAPENPPKIVIAVTHHTHLTREVGGDRVLYKMARLAWRHGLLENQVGGEQCRG